MPHPHSAKLCFYTDSTYFSGAERAFGLLADSCAASGYDVRLHVTPQVFERFKPFLPESTTPLANRLKYSVAAYRSFLNELQTTKPAVVVVNMWSPYSNTLFLMAARRLGIPAITIYHYYQEKRMVTGPLRPLKLWAYGFGERLASQVLTVSEAHKDILIREFGFPENKVDVLPNGVPAPAEKPSFSDHSPRRLLTVGSLEPAKGYGFAIKVLEKVSAPLSLTIVGDGPSRPELEALAKASSKEVQLLGRRTDMDAIYQDHDVLLQPSHFENLSMAIIEAMSYGLATIANDVGGNRELIRTGKEGWLLELENEEQWSQAIEKACTEPLADLRTNASSRWKSHFSLQHQLTVFERFLHETINSR
jgi:glycosyltransferase involved in cell wall biosynthesis